MQRNRAPLPPLAAALLLGTLATTAPAQHAGHGPPPPEPAARDEPPAQHVPSPVRAELRLTPTRPDRPDRSRIYEREEFELHVKLTDARSGLPVSGARPMAWIDVRPESGATTGAMCRQRIGAFLDGAHGVRHGQGYAARPVDDLNTHYLVALTRSNHLVVIDPLNSFGKTRLFTTVPLESAGEDWVESEDGGRFYVSLPRAGKLAVVNTHTWKVEAGIRVGDGPARLAMHPDHRHLWVSHPAAGDAPAGVSVVDVLTRRVAARIATGAGPHAMAFSPDGKRAFVANGKAGTLSVIDVERRATLQDLELGGTLSDLAYSPTTGEVLVTDRAGGRLLVIDAATLETRETVPLQPGVSTVRFAPAVEAGHTGHGHDAAPAPAGRFAFVLNPEAGKLVVYDAVARRQIRAMDIAGSPDQVGFSASWAYIRSAGSPNVVMIPVADPTRGGNGPHDFFAAGNSAPGSSEALGLGEVFVRTPDMGDAVYVINPKERMIYTYHYMEGMPVPHGGFTTYGFEPRAIRTVSRRMRESAPGEYTATLRLDRRGEYDLLLRAPEQELVECIGFPIHRDPARHAAGVDVRIAGPGNELRTGESQVELRLLDAESQAPLTEIRDARIQLASPMGWQHRAALTPVGDGVYRATVPVPAAGAYYAAVEIPSRNLRFEDRSPLIFRAGLPRSVER